MATVAATVAVSDAALVGEGAEVTGAEAGAEVPAARKRRNGSQ